jgi:hypothetical protein
MATLMTRKAKIVKMESLLNQRNTANALSAQTRRDMKNQKLTLTVSVVLLYYQFLTVARLMAILLAEEEPEPEVDLSAFLARQRLEPDDTIVSKPDDDEVDHTLSHLPSTSNTSKSRKNNVHIVEWDASLDELKREKEAAEAVRGLKFS